jgi:hypothetical protein
VISRDVSMLIDVWDQLAGAALHHTAERLHSSSEGMKIHELSMRLLENRILGAVTLDWYRRSAFYI